MTRPAHRPLPARLAAVGALCPPGARLADVGSDHGLLPLALLAEGLAAFAIATERTSARAARIGRPPSGVAWDGCFAVRTGDGLAPLRPEDAFDTIVLAGLGGGSIVRILAGGELPALAPSCLVLQPRSGAALVRRWLSENGWRPTEERLDTCRGRRHLTLRAEPGDDADLYTDDSLSREDLLAAGPLLVRSGAREAASAWREAAERLRRIVGSPHVRPDSAAGARTELLRAERIAARLHAS